VKKNQYYRLNPSRSIQVIGTIDKDLLSRVTPQILKLQAQSREPITVYIDSNGGSVNAMETLLNVLRLSDQDSSNPCHIITAVTTKAASAAADLLSAGDYAAAFPYSTILYHGIRTEGSEKQITAEYSSRLAAILRRLNDRYALELAKKIDFRFSFRFVFVYEQFPAIRQSRGNPDLSDLECFFELIQSKLSPEAQNVWQRARIRHSRYRQLFEPFARKVGNKKKEPTVAELEGSAIKAFVDFEIKANKDKPDWRFSSEGIERLAEDFALFLEYAANLTEDRLLRWSDQWGKLVIRTERLAEIEAIESEEKRKEALESEIRSLMDPLTSFFSALCHALQEGENSLTAEDAYWLGLVDEVVGRNDLLCSRYFEESEDDSQKGEEKQEEE
jgi:ATP-dependent protease ClpP protease subunit